MPIALGADGGGSIRLPSAYCGIWGLKTSHGRVSASPTPSLAPSVGVIGPMAATLDDLALSYRLMAAPGPGNPSSARFPSPARPAAAKKKKIIGIIPAQYDRAAPAVRSLCRSVVDGCADKLGYTVLREVPLPFAQEGQLAHAITILCELSAQIGAFVPPTLAGVTPANQTLLAVTRQTPAADLLLAQKLRNLYMQHLAWLFAEHPDLVLVSPTTPLAGRKIQPGDLSHGVSDGEGTKRSMENVWLANFTGCPAISVPVGKAEGHGGDGEVPVGLMGMSMWGNEEGLLEWAAGLEALNGKGTTVGAERPDTWVDLFGLAKEEAGSVPNLLPLPFPCYHVFH